MNPSMMGLVILLALGLPGDDSRGQLLEESLLKEDPAALANAVRESGNAARGAIVFFQPSLTCSKCHAVGEGKADPIGPDLSKLGREVTSDYLIESVLRPSKVVKKGFETVTIGDGRWQDADRPARRGPTRSPGPPRPLAGREARHDPQARDRTADRRRSVGHARRPLERAQLAAAIPRPDPLPPRDRRRRPRACAGPDPRPVADRRLEDPRLRAGHRPRRDDRRARTREPRARRGDLRPRLRQLPRHQGPGRARCRHHYGSPRASSRTARTRTASTAR